VARPLVIAEVKIRSPFGWAGLASWDDQFDFANTHGDWISVHTDRRWDGSLDLVRKARDLTDKPILAKGIHVSDIEVEEAFDAGADWCLVVGRIPSVHRDRCLIEPRNLYELSLIPEGTKVVWNARDLETGRKRTVETFRQAREQWPGWLCQASFIRTPKDVFAHSLPDAILVGTNLRSFFL